MKSAEQIAMQVISNSYELDSEVEPGVMAGWFETLNRALDSRDESTPEDILNLIVAAIEADRAQRREMLETEASILDSYRRGLVGKIDSATDHNLMRASEAMRVTAGWDGWDAFKAAESYTEVPA